MTQTEYTLQKLGEDKCLCQLMEECAELITAINKYKRYGNNKQDVISEIADVLICLEYPLHILEITDDELTKEILFKIKRTVERINKNGDNTNEK